jgi:hypothetical protein
MRKTVLTFGVISGLLFTVMMIATLPFADRIGFDKSEVLGYTTMVLAFLLVFFGVRSYRENVGNGEITFAKGFVVGILITLISSVFYVATWEILYFKFMPDFFDKYSAYVAAKAQASGASAQVVQQQIADLQQMKQAYSNPLYNSMITFLEPLPVGMIMTLLSAALLRKRRKTNAAANAATA